MNLLERLRRETHSRTEWVEPHGEIDIPVFDDMAGEDGVRSTLVNPDGPEAATRIAALEERVRVLEGAIDGIDEQARHVALGYSKPDVTDAIYELCRLTRDARALGEQP